MAQYWDLEKLTEEWEARGFSRRELMRLLAGGAGMSVMLALLGRSQSAAAQGATPATGAGTAAPAAQGGTVNVLWRKPISLSPIFSTSGNEQQVERLMFGALVVMSDKLVPTPDLAEKVDVNEDASVYTFHLHENAKFSDGTPLTAKDVVFTFERAIDSRTGSYWRGRLLGIKGATEYGDQKADSVAGLATPDDYTVEVTLAEPDAAFLVNLGNFSGLGILPEHVLKDVAPDQMQQHPFTMAPTVTAGAFQYVQYAEDQYLELERNDTYWGTPPPLDKIFLQILTPDVGLAKLQTGEINLMTLPVSEAETTRKIQGVTVASVPSPSVSFLALNMERPYLQSKELRQAMAYAIDREGILKQVFSGEGQVVNSPIIGPDWMGIPEGLNPYEYNPDTAKELLGKSGYDKNQKIQFMFIPGQSKENDATVAIIQQQLKQVGFNIELLQVDVAESGRRFVQETDYDMDLGGGGVFRADPSVSGTYFQTSMFTPGGGNYSHYSNPEIDKLYPQAQQVKDPEERKKIYTQIAKILNDELPWIFLWSPNSLYALTDTLHGFAPPSYIDNKLWNAETWSVTPAK
jgi:peptide/nickel transport system substrate-binding protein